MADDRGFAHASCSADLMAMHCGAASQRDEDRAQAPDRPNDPPADIPDPPPTEDEPEGDDIPDVPGVEPPPVPIRDPQPDTQPAGPYIS